MICPVSVSSDGTGRVRDGKPENMFDGDPLSYFAVPDGGGAVVDFGHPVVVGRLSYIRRGDGNDIFPGDEYELMYWEDGDWRLHEKVVADDVFLDFHDVPSGTLYFIRDCTRGSQNRVFEYRDGQVIWR